MVSLSTVWLAYWVLVGILATIIVGTLVWALANGVSLLDEEDR